MSGWWPPSAWLPCWRRPAWESRDVQELVGLQAQPPLRVLQAVTNRQLRVPFHVRAVHRLQEEVAEVVPLELPRVRAGLGEDELQFVPGPEHQLGPGLGADADPVDPLRRQP